jgi:hypothetical protein
MTMSTIQGIKEKVHLPIYDSIAVKPAKQLREIANSSTLKFFVDVQGKTRLETNLQSASLPPNSNTFEARGMRVVISDLPPEFPDDSKKLEVRVKELQISGANTARNAAAAGTATTLTTDLKRVMELLDEARQDNDKKTEIHANDEDLNPRGAADQTVALTVADLEGAVKALDRKAPPKEQIRPHSGAGTIIGRLVYNTVITFYVGEKVMVQMPTCFFPPGAGPYSEARQLTTHGEPSPTATFRFAEPIFIDKQQNFRVEMEIPDSRMLQEVQKIYGPLFIWVVLDGYMTRDVS